MCRGAKIFFGQSVRVSKKGFSKKMCTFSFCLFYVGERKIEKMKNMENENFTKTQKKNVLGWL